MRDRADYSDGSEIHVTDADGSNQTRLTNNSANDSFPAWSPAPHSYAFNGFFRPVGNSPTLNVVEAGRAVPMKFSLGRDEGLDIFAEGYPKSQRINCFTSAPLDGIAQTVSAGEGGLSYDPTTERCTYGWKTTKAWSGTCRQFVMMLDDGTIHRANFKYTYFGAHSDFPNSFGRGFLRSSLAGSCIILPFGTADTHGSPLRRYTSDHRISGRSIKMQFSGSMRTFS